MIQKTYYKTKDYCKVKFVYSGDNAETVEVLGLNSDWKTPIAMKRKKDGTFVCEVVLPKDTEQEFKYRINGKEWINDPDADNQKPNEFGSVNSVLVL